MANSALRWLASFTRSHKVLAGLVCLLLVFLVTATVLHCYESAWTDDEARHWHAWIQLWTGAAVSDAGELDRTSPFFAGAAALQIMLSLGSVIGIIWVLLWLVIMFIAERRQVMKYVDAFIVRDATIKAELRNRLLHIVESPHDREEISNSLNEIFDTASQRWKERHLKTALGEKEAELLIKRLHGDISPS